MQSDSAASGASCTHAMQYGYSASQARLSACLMYCNYLKWPIYLCEIFTSVHMDMLTNNCEKDTYNNIHCTQAILQWSTY
jgi:hypothetical protein